MIMVSFWCICPKWDERAFLQWCLERSSKNPLESLWGPFSTLLCSTSDYYCLNLKFWLTWPYLNHSGLGTASRSSLPPFQWCPSIDCFNLKNRIVWPHSKYHQVGISLLPGGGERKKGEGERRRPISSFNININIREDPGSMESHPLHNMKFEEIAGKHHINSNSCWCGDQMNFMEAAPCPRRMCPTFVLFKLLQIHRTVLPKLFQRALQLVVTKISNELHASLKGSLPSITNIFPTICCCGRTWKIFFATLCQVLWSYA